MFSLWPKNSMNEMTQWRKSSICLRYAFINLSLKMIHLKSIYNMASGSSLAITVTTLRSHFSHDWLTLLHWIHSGYKYFRYLNNGTLRKNSFTLLKFFVRQMFERQLTIWDDAEVLNKRLTNASWAPLSTVNNSFILLKMELCIQLSIT